MTYTTNEVATKLGVTPGRVRQLADALGLDRRFGRDRVFDDADVDLMRQRHTKPGPVPRKRQPDQDIGVERSGDPE